jgi:GTP cyclohydrolase I
MSNDTRDSSRYVEQLDALQAVRTLLLYIGEDPDREGLKDTPRRVLASFGEHFAGYKQDPAEVMKTTFADTGGYDEIVVLNGISYTSHCEHHMSLILGTAHVGYLPAEGGPVVGLSKLARVVDIFARRLTIQEKMTAEIADMIEQQLNPRGIAVVLEAQHSCTNCRGARKRGSTMITSAMRGFFRDKSEARQEVMSLLLR